MIWNELKLQKSSLISIFAIYYGIFILYLVGFTLLVWLMPGHNIPRIHQLGMGIVAAFMLALWSWGLGMNAFLHGVKMGATRRTMLGHTVALSALVAAVFYVMSLATGFIGDFVIDHVWRVIKPELWVEELDTGMPSWVLPLVLVGAIAIGLIYAMVFLRFGMQIGGFVMAGSGITVGYLIPSVVHKYPFVNDIMPYLGVILVIGATIWALRGYLRMTVK